MPKWIGDPSADSAPLTAPDAAGAAGGGGGHGRAAAGAPAAGRRLSFADVTQRLLRMTQKERSEYLNRSLEEHSWVGDAATYGPIAIQFDSVAEEFQRRHKEGKPFVVSLIPETLAEEYERHFVGVVIDDNPKADGSSVRIEWRSPEEGGPPGHEARQTIETREWWDGGGQAWRVGNQIAEFMPHPEDMDMDDSETGGGANRHLFGDLEDEANWYELHWAVLRNLFPHWCRCQEDEDAVTDVYCDMLGPRTHAHKDYNHSKFGEGRDGYQSSEAYRMDEMQHLILPQWEYRKPGLQMANFLRDDDDRKEEEEMLETEPLEELPSRFNRRGKFPPLATCQELEERSPEYWQEREHLLCGQEDGIDKEAYTWPHLHCNDDYDWRAYLKARFLRHPYLLADKSYDAPLDPGDEEDCVLDEETCEELGVQPDCPNPDQMDTMKGRVATAQYLVRELTEGNVAHLWEMRGEVDEALPYLEGVPALERTQDKYEIATWCWLRCRIFIEKKGIAQRAIVLFFNILLQVVCALILWGLAGPEMQGGSLEVVLVGFLTGIMGLISGLVGLAGVLSQNEDLLQKFWVCQLWMVSVLVSFLMTQAYYSNSNAYACGGTNPGDSPNNMVGCDETNTRINAAIAMSTVELLLGWMSIYQCTALLDGINDMGALEDNMEFFKYMQYYLNELLRRVQMKPTAGLKGRFEASQDPSGYYVDALLGPIRGKYTDTDWHEGKDGDAEAPWLKVLSNRGEELEMNHPKTGYYTKEDFFNHFKHQLGDKTTAAWLKAAKQAKKMWEDRKTDEVPWASSNPRGVCKGMVVRCEVDGVDCIGTITERHEDFVEVEWEASRQFTNTDTSELPTSFTKDTWPSCSPFPVFVEGDRVKFVDGVSPSRAGPKYNTPDGESFAVRWGKEGTVQTLPDKNQWAQGIVAVVLVDAEAYTRAQEVLVQYDQIELTQAGNIGALRRAFGPSGGAAAGTDEDRE